jgi:hypothetical protein
MHFRLVEVMDSSYLVECRCEHLLNWTENAVTGVLEIKKGNTIANLVEFMVLIVVSMVGNFMTSYGPWYW